MRPTQPTVDRVDLMVVCRGLILASRRVRHIGDFQRREFVCQPNQPLHHFRPFGVRDMNETVSAEFIGRRLDSLQNDVSGLNCRMVTLESNLIDRGGALEARWLGSKST